MEHEILLDVRHLTHIFPLSRKTAVKAVDDVSFQIRRGEIFGLVGESGSGKSTAARCVMNIYQPYAGQIYYKGIDTCDRGQFRKNKKMLQTTRQMIFQDSGSSLNQKMKVRDIIEEPMRVQKIRPLRGSYEEEARFQMKYVGLDPEYLKKYPGAKEGYNMPIFLHDEIIGVVGIFGCGDQEDYADYFCDAIGTVRDIVEPRGAIIVGNWSTDGYTFEASKALLDDGNFIGLCIDEDRQPELTAERVEKWTKQIYDEMCLAELA